MNVMKAALPHLALISGLVAAVVGDALPPEDIPVECATICGPIIELTASCSTKWQRLVKRDHDAVVRREWVPKLAVEPPEVNTAGTIEQREVIILLPSPEQATTTSTSLNLRPSSVPTRISPVTSTSSVSRYSSVRSTSTRVQLSTSTSTVTTLITFTKTSATSVTSATLSPSLSESETTMTSSLQVQEPQGQMYTQDNGERDCVCLASSFDVAKVTALCSSCVAQNGFSNTNINVIVNGCNFPALAYSLSQDSLVDNVRVEAVGPSSSSTSGTAQFAATKLEVAMAAWGLILAVAMVA